MLDDHLLPDGVPCWAQISWLSYDSPPHIYAVPPDTSLGLIIFFYFFFVVVKDGEKRVHFKMSIFGESTQN